ncbi:MAG: histidyl-tRNA synthetase [Parcubacteria group bacterium Gr01-1014_66]|nr:MAG: histidyl-tRNA synthetase [Parcubacteria group bacterium Gr01-1014_66]
MIPLMVAKNENSQQSQKSTKKERRVKPDLPGGFRDYGPSEAIARAQMIETIRKTFESFGFDPLETSSVQRTEVLIGGDEDSNKIIYRIRPAQRGEIVGTEEKDENSLRFDLTVPLARFVAANPDIPKPFKRYQIGTVWRGERPQAGRYREFMQADVDIVGSSSMTADADDKKDKIGAYEMKNEISKIFNPEIAVKVDNFLRYLSEPTDRDKSDPLYEEMGTYIDQSSSLELMSYMDRLGIANYQFDISIVRGLEYYTGIIFEVVLTDSPEMGSIFSGGRYDNLVSQFTGQNISAVGASIGIDRLFASMEKLGVSKKQQTLTQALVLNLSVELVSDYLKMAQQLRDANINTSFYLGDDTSFQAQLAYAVKKEIPFVIIYGEEEKKKGVVAVKNLRTREQKEIKKEKLVAFFKK